MNANLILPLAAEVDDQTTGLLQKIGFLDGQLDAHFKSKLQVNPALNRQMVSFQANKTRALYRWYKYKEGFSASLIEYLFNKFDIKSGKVLDPFAGSGTTLFVASEHGMDSDGIELLQIGQQIIKTRQVIESDLDAEVIDTLKDWIAEQPWVNGTSHANFGELRITKGAYPEHTKGQIQQYLAAIELENAATKQMLLFALLCVLESVSFTRKDGQYLRWDDRSERRVGNKPFDKGQILKFDIAITEKLKEIVDDLSFDSQVKLFPSPSDSKGRINLLGGSCLDVMPTLRRGEYDAIVTSPPYCNRYDYTRTYALELALLGVTDSELIDLRQQMLSCTVENRAKDLIGKHPQWRKPIEVADSQQLLQAILEYLEHLKGKGALNNNGIARMVRGYFYEMACVIAESARVLTPDGRMIMVNDNVRYAGVSVPVDLILSSFAEQLGFEVEKIFVLPNGKGNSSQQMGLHGREALRKCVYIWKRV